MVNDLADKKQPFFQKKSLTFINYIIYRALSHFC
jgi:hypothetical protein